MKISEHKTMLNFLRKKLVDDDDVKVMRWLEEKLKAVGVGTLKGIKLIGMMYT